MTGSKNIIIQPRDLSLFRTLALLRAIDREQAKRIGGFTSITRVNARLLGLVKAKVLNRFFLGTGPGTQKAIYTLTPKGAALAGVRYKRFRRTHNSLYSGDLFLEHQLLLNEIYLSLHKDEHLVRGQNWKTFEKPVLNSSIIPDAYFEIVTEDAIKPVFLEVDKSTESKTIWKKKAGSYLSFALSGAFEKQFSHSQFRVLVITTTHQQLRRIQSAISEQTSKVFWLTTFDDIKRLGLFSAIWQRPKGEGRVPFF